VPLSRFNEARLSLLEAMAEEEGWTYWFVVSEYNNNREFRRRIDTAASHIAGETDIPPSLNRRARGSHTVH
jgi:hypothetical protein